MIEFGFMCDLFACLYFCNHLELVKEKKIRFNGSEGGDGKELLQECVPQRITAVE